MFQDSTTNDVNADAAADQDESDASTRDPIADTNVDGDSVALSAAATSEVAIVPPATDRGEPLNTAGTAVMSISIVLVLSLVLYCLAKVFTLPPVESTDA